MNNRGSEWRQWDLHFHTPASYDYEDMSITNQEIINHLVANGVSAVAITDHHIIDVQRIKELQSLGKDKIIVFPGIEFLSEARGKEPIHFIGIFSNLCDIDYVWGQIENRTNIRRIKGEGKHVNEVYCDLQETCELIHSLGGIVTIHAGSKSNSLEKITNSLPHYEAMKDDISKYVNVFDMGKEEDFQVYRKHVFPNIHRLVPMIISSDNHNIKNYQRKAITWIKADCTFEGLKQILFEPDERVSICSNKPDEKSIYNVIDYISLSEPGFWEGSIYLNQNLNTIIGGRSTGKSSLLNAIAAKHECNELEKENYIWNHLNNINICWADGNSQLGRDIEFLPQSYMHTIARSKEKTNKIVERIILHKDIGGLINSLQVQQQKNQKIISEAVFSLFNLFDELQKERKALSEQGVKEGVKQQISLLEARIAEVQKKGHLSIEENTVYQTLEKELKNKEGLLSNADQDIESLIRIRTISPIKQSFETEIGLGLLTFHLNASESIKSFRKLKEYAEKEWVSIIEKIISNTKESKTKIESEIAGIKNNDTYKKGVAHYIGNKELKDLNEKLLSENKHLQAIERIELRIKSIRERLNTLTKEIVRTHLEFKSNSKNVVDQLSVNVDGLGIKVSMACQTEKMRELLENRLVMRGANRREYVDSLISKYDGDTAAQSQTFLIDLVYGKVELKGSTNPLSLATEFLSKNWYTLNYELNYQGDSFDKMSEGKQAFVILKLLLEFSDKQCPILIDQPEDSLDNRAIYNELVEYIKNKKKVRQIILVTHNSNVVVSADAENVIVANQDGINCPNEANNRFEYVNGSLECSMEKDSSIPVILESQGIREHVCDILEGGRTAFEKREHKYGFK